MNPYKFYPAGVRDDPEISIGSSDIPVIIKTRTTTIKKSQRELWLEKTGQVPQWKGNFKTKLGHELEPIVAGRHIAKIRDEETAYKYKLDFVLHEEFRAFDYKPPTEFLPYTEARHPKFPWAVAHADILYPAAKFTGLYTDTKDVRKFHLDNGPCLWEIKTGGYFARVKRDDHQGFDIDSKSDLEDPDKIPIEVMLQVQWQMLCYGILKTIVLLMVDNEIYTFEIPAFQKWWPIMIEKASRFYQHCITGEVPPPEKKEDVFGMFDTLKDKAVYVTGDRALIAEAMKIENKKIKANIKRLKARGDDIEDAAVLLMGENKYLFNGETATKLFSQTLIKDQWGMIHPNRMDEEDIKKYLERGDLKKHNTRRVN